MSTKTTQQERIKTLQQAVIKENRGMDFLLHLRKTMQKKIDRLENRISKTHCSNAKEFRSLDKLELEFYLVNAKLFDGKFEDLI